MIKFDQTIYGHSFRCGNGALIVFLKCIYQLEKYLKMKKEKGLEDHNL